MSNERINEISARIPADKIIASELIRVSLMRCECVGVTTNVVEFARGRVEALRRLACWSKWDSTPSLSLVATCAPPFHHRPTPIQTEIHHTYSTRWKHKESYGCVFWLWDCSARTMVNRSIPKDWWRPVGVSGEVYIFW